MIPADLYQDALEDLRENCQKGQWKYMEADYQSPAHFVLTHTLHGLAAMYQAYYKQASFDSKHFNLLLGTYGEYLQQHPIDVTDVTKHAFFIWGQAREAVKHMGLAVPQEIIEALLGGFEADTPDYIRKSATQFLIGQFLPAAQSLFSTQLHNPIFMDWTSLKKHWEGGHPGLSEATISWQGRMKKRERAANPHKSKERQGAKKISQSIMDFEHYVEGHANPILTRKSFLEAMTLLGEATWEDVQGHSRDAMDVTEIKDDGLRHYYFQEIEWALQADIMAANPDSAPFFCMLAQAAKAFKGHLSRAGQPGVELQMDISGQAANTDPLAWPQPTVGKITGNFGCWIRKQMTDAGVPEEAWKENFWKVMGGMKHREKLFNPMLNVVSSQPCNLGAAEGMYLSNFILPSFFCNKWVDEASYGRLRQMLLDVSQPPAGKPLPKP